MLKSIYFLAAALLTITVHANTAETKLNDAQIRNVLITINEGEIAAAQLASQRAQNPDVKNLATMMLTEHKENIKETKKITKDNKIKAKESKLSKDLKKEAWKSNQDLKKTEAAAFDKTYVDQQVMMHAKALTTLKDILIPNAQDAALKAHLERTRDAVQAHLEHAQAVQAKL